MHQHWNSWTINGIECSHNQIDQATSGPLIQGGWAAVFATIGVVVAFDAGIYATAAAALICGVLGALFGYMTQAQLSDEAGCIWWWGNDFQNWFMANVWWFVLWSSVGAGAVGAVLRSIGYLRIGDYTFIDGQGRGNQ